MQCFAKGIDIGAEEISRGYSQHSTREKGWNEHCCLCEEVRRSLPVRSGRQSQVAKDCFLTPAKTSQDSNLLLNTTDSRPPTSIRLLNPRIRNNYIIPKPGKFAPVGVLKRFIIEAGN